MARSIQTVIRELKYLEYNYQHLRIKTIEYREEKNKLKKELKRLNALNEKDLAKIYLNEKKQTKSKLERKYSKDLNLAQTKESRFIDEEETNIRG